MDRETPALPVRDQMDVLRGRYAARLPDRIRDIVAAWGRLRDGSADPEGLASFHRSVHNLAGSGRTYGFPAVSDAARTLEIMLRLALRTGGLPRPDQRVEIDHLLDALREAAAAGPEVANAAGGRPADAADPAWDDREILLLGGDPARPGDAGAGPSATADLPEQLGHYGYRLRPVAGVGELREALRRAPPAALLIDASLLVDANVERVLSASDPFGEGRPFPILFLSDHGDLSARLRSVRAGGQAHLVKPVDVNALVDELDRWIGGRTPDPYRILVVDDDPDQLAGFEIMLRVAGMIPFTTADPAAAVRAMAEFNPDLVLVDLYMPDCRGTELAAVIRQQEAYVGVPIVYLSAESDPERQRAALRRGADDFLTKSITAPQLISAVHVRAERSRVLRSFMVHDGLTGLYNHVKIKEQLAVEVARAGRQGASLAFAMIDIDHFKDVNDTHGHPAGDRVLKSLAHLLGQRLRKTDLIGRYGGEEFAVILPGLDGPGAAEVLEEVRRRFAGISHRAGEEAFHVTFSGGIADYPRFADAARLNEAADRALYRAKHLGRNRLVLAPG